MNGGGAGQRVLTKPAAILPHFSLAARTLTSLKLRRRGAATIFARPRRLAVIFISTGPVKLRRSPRNFIPRGPGLNATSTTFCPSNTRFFRNSPVGVVAYVSRV